MKWIITGGAGFIGVNLAKYLVDRGHAVHVIDDLSRPGSELNASILQSELGLSVLKVDVADTGECWAALAGVGSTDAIAHLAGQVSMQQSLADPYRDFQVNALGTLNILEFVRRFDPGACVIGMSSNKIYGSLSQVRIEEVGDRYIAPDWPLGFDESLRIHFETPYGCSKGTADQYLGDYAQMYGLTTASLRQSSVYGPLQRPREDQGWVSFFLAEAISGRQIALNGNGKQVRDLLHVSDLSRLIERLPTYLVSGERHQVNVGGGPSNTLSILELFKFLREEFGVDVQFNVGGGRISDQSVFVSANTTIGKMTGWAPKVGVFDGLSEMVANARY